MEVRKVLTSFGVIIPEMLVFLIYSPYFCLNFTGFVFYVLILTCDFDVNLDNTNLLVESSQILC